MDRTTLRTANSWYGSARWKRKRAEFLRAHPLCAMCRQRGVITPARVADHIEPHRGDYDKFWNGRLQPLCIPCHSGAKQEFEKSATVRGCDENGIPFATPGLRRFG